MTNAIKVLLQMTSVFLQPVPSLVCLNSKFSPPVELCWQNKNTYFSIEDS
jgi:hypothetical protein